MSTTAPLPGTAPSAAPPAPDRNEIKVVSHSNLFYWWPVWAVGYLMAILTLIDGHLLATVPKGTKAVKEVNAAGEKREAYVLPKGEHVKRGDDKDLDTETVDPRVHVSKSKSLGVTAVVGEAQQS